MKQTILKTIILPSTLLLGCGPKQSSTLDTEVPGESIAKPSGLGEGFDSERLKWKSRCVEGDHKWIGANKASLFLESNLGYLDLKNRLSGQLEVGFETAGLNIQGEAYYAKAASSTEQSFSLNYLSQMETKSMVISDPKITELGQAYIGADGAVSDLVSQGCGDEFVSQIDYGASLAINVKMSFLNSSDKEKLGGQASLKISLLSIAGKLDKLDESVKKNATVTIVANQVGGDTTKLAMILPPSGLSCPMLDFESCAKTLEALSYYATSGFPDGDHIGGEGTPEEVADSVTESYPNIVPFHAQFDSDPADDDPFGWVHQLFVTKKYKDQSFLHDGQPVMLVPVNDNPLLTAAVRQARIDIMTDLESYIAISQRANEVKRLFAINDEKKAEIVQLLEDASFNVRLASDQGQICYSEPEECLEALELYHANLKEVDPSVLSLNEEDLVDPGPELTGWMLYCSAGVDERMETTVKHILDMLETNDCSEAHARLGDITNFHGPANGMVSTQVVAELRNISTLVLRNSELSNQDLIHIVGLKKIKWAMLEGNNISDMSFFKSWPGLTYLDLEWNPLSSSQPLTGLGHLSLLNVANTGIDSIAPFANVNGGQKDWSLVIAAQNNHISNTNALEDFKQVVMLGLTGNPATSCPDHSISGVYSSCSF